MDNLLPQVTNKIVYHAPQRSNPEKKKTEKYSLSVLCASDQFHSIVISNSIAFREIPKVPL